jgi:hypothetical protein
MKIMVSTIAILLCFSLSHGTSVDSVTVDSVWNSDSSWYDGNGVLQQRFARDCVISFIPRDSGFASCTLKVSLDSGKTWSADPNPLTILDSSLSKPISCGQKKHIKARLFGGDRQNVVFKIDANICVNGDDESITGPLGATIVFSEGFGNDLTRWKDFYMINIGDYYSKMRTTADAAHAGTFSLTSDSNRTALIHDISPRIETGIAGLQFYIMAKAAGHTNFTVQFGQNAGSSGGLGKAFGLGFDKSDSVKVGYYDLWDMNPQSDSMLAPIRYNRWYKCAVEVDFTAQKITWKLDDAVVKTQSLPTSDMNGFDEILVLRGMDGADGPKPYYADDIVLYTR